MARRRAPTDFERAMGNRLREVRRAKGMTQVELAEASGIPVSVIRKWESGTRTPLSDGLLRVAEALDVCADQLLGRPWRRWPRW